MSKSVDSSSSRSNDGEGGSGGGSRGSFRNGYFSMDYETGAVAADPGKMPAASAPAALLIQTLPQLLFFPTLVWARFLVFQCMLSLLRPLFRQESLLAV